MASSLIIVSNRLPISVKRALSGRLEYYPSVGGLATGLASYVDNPRNKWIGWPGIPSDNLSRAEREEISVELRRSNCYPVFLTQKQLDEFYNGYSNTILWPLFHDLPARTEDHDRFWASYRKVNSAFAGVVLALSDDDSRQSRIWVHDYQLLLMPAMLRAVRPKARIGFFLHIPFPGLKHFKQISTARKLLEGLMGADLVGFHTRLYANNFLAACAELTNEIVEPRQVLHGAHVTRVQDFPMGIDYERFTRARDLSGVKHELAKHRRKYRGLKVILTVDRLDPTKGLAERLIAYQEFLRRTPSIHGKVIMVMLAVPSRTEIDEYKQLRERVEGLVAEITDEFGTDTWQPLDYMYTSMPVEAVTALYQVADIAFITPLRDGMNLVAKEYIASRPKRDGVLILSSTAGAAQELTDALLVNPRKPETLVTALTDAVQMPQRELKRRITRMHTHISTHTVQDWAKSFMGTLQKPVPGTRRLTRTITPKHRQLIVDAFAAAERPLLLLDYDGVLAPHVNDPRRASPNKAVLQILLKLAERPDTHVAIVSGRSRADLSDWLGDMPLSLVAEHGAWLRSPRPGHEPAPEQSTDETWQQLAADSGEWQSKAAPILEKYAQLTPGAFVETKDFSMVWHYRAASSYYAQKHLVILRRLLRPIAKRYGLGINNGNKILEIKPMDINKGTATQELLLQSIGGAERQQPDFVLAIGDDYTDEDMFEALEDSRGDSAYTIKVGRAPTAARYRLKSEAEVRTLLRALAAAKIH